MPAYNEAYQGQAGGSPIPGRFLSGGFPTMDPNELRLRLSRLDFCLACGEHEVAHELLAETLYDLDNPEGDWPPGEVVFVRDDEPVSAPVSGEINAFDAKCRTYDGALRAGFLAPPQRHP